MVLLLERLDAVFLRTSDAVSLDMGRGRTPPYLYPLTAHCMYLLLCSRRIHHLLMQLQYQQVLLLDDALV